MQRLTNFYRFMQRGIARAVVDSRGLTLVELLVVLAILGLLAALIVPRAVDYLGRAKSDTAEVQIKRLISVLDLYRLDVGQYPSDQQGLAALITMPSDAASWNGPYIKDAEGLLDPWGRPYLYRMPGEHGDFDLWSLGADGAEGGEGEDRDITIWQP